MLLGDTVLRYLLIEGNCAFQRIWQNAGERVIRPSIPSIQWIDLLFEMCQMIFKGCVTSRGYSRGTSRGIFKGNIQGLQQPLIDVKVNRKCCYGGWTAFLYVRCVYKSRLILCVGSVEDWRACGSVILISNLNQRNPGTLQSCWYHLDYKNNNFWGDLINVSARTKNTVVDRHQCFCFQIK